MTDPADWIRPEILALEPYRVADARGLIKLDAMENPYPMPEALRRAWGERLQATALNRYPDAGGEAVKSGLRRAMRIPDDAALMLGNGSDELLQILMLALAREDACLLTPEPGFAMFRLISRVTGLDYAGVPLARDFALDTDAMLAAIERRRPALVLIAQPNNPTGNAFDPGSLRAIVEAAPGLAVIDEAYYPFAEDDCLDWLQGHDNLLIMRTVSKLGLAGLRLGLLAGPPRWIEALEPLRLPYNINALTQAGAAFALEHYAAFTEQAAAIVEQRGRLAEALAGLPGLRVFPSRANFLLVQVPAGRADALHAGLCEHGVLVKNLDAAHDRLRDCLRITVGMPEENRALIEALTALL